MSLINEALKRARIEAARRDAAEKGVPVASLPVYVPERRRPWLAPLLGFAVGLVSVAVAIGAFWLLARPQAPSAVETIAATAPSSSREPEPAGQPASLPAGTAHEAEPMSATVEPSLVEPPLVEPPLVEPPLVEPLAAAESASRAPDPVSQQTTPASPSRAETAIAEPPTVEPVESPIAVTAVPAAGPVPTAPEASKPKIVDSSAAAPPRVAPKESERTFLRQAELPGGVQIKLDFIVWSEARPFAQINGELVNPGQLVEGYILRRIERDRVTLEADDGATFWVRVK